MNYAQCDRANAARERNVFFDEVVLAEIIVGVSFANYRFIFT